jgi:hypothetical protein
VTIARPAAAGWALAAMMALALAGSVYAIPIQVDDSVDVIVRSAGFTSVGAAFVDGLYNSRTILRPLKQVRTKLLLDLGNALGGRYHAAFRGYHALIAALLIVLFVYVARVRSWPDVAALALALTVLTGMQTFTGLVREAYPVNHFLLIALYVLLMLAIARSRGGWIADAASIALFMIGTLTLESGVLLWPIAAAGYMAGQRGISRWGLAGMTAVAIGYVALRVGYLGMEGAQLGERATGFGAGALSSADQIQRFGDNPVPLYIYNVLMAAISVLLSQPESGQWTIVEAWRAGRVTPVFWVSIGSSAATTALIAWSMCGRAPSGHRRWTDPIPLVFLAGLAANAAISYAYAKTEIMSVAGVLYALAAFAATRELLGRTQRRGAAIAVAVLLACVASAWGVRSAGLHFKLRHGAFDARGEWAAVLPPDARDRWPHDPAIVALLTRMKQEAVMTRSATATALPRNYQRWWGED